MPLTSEPWGDAQRVPVRLHTLRSAGGLVARVADWGATLVSLVTPDRGGRMGDVLLGFDSLQDYMAPHPYIGATIGRVANRIAGAAFELDGRRHALAPNEGANQLHGGPRAFDRRVWTAQVIDTGAAPSIALRLASPDGDNGFPGRLEIETRYTLDDTGLEIAWSARCDAATLVNPTSHAYFNLGDDPTIVDHLLRIDAEAFVPVDAAMIPLDAVRSVAGTPMDFRGPQRIGERIDGADTQLLHGDGYDHCWLLSPHARAEPVAELRDPLSGRRLRISTTQPALQFYTGNRLDGSLVGRHGRRYVRRAGLCLETQWPPDAPHHPAFGSLVLRPGERWRHCCRWIFDTV